VNTLPSTTELLDLFSEQISSAVVSVMMRLVFSTSIQLFTRHKLVQSVTRLICCIVGVSFLHIATRAVNRVQIFQG
jgi:hypothetical protein